MDALPPPAPEVRALALMPRHGSVTANGLRFAYVEWGDPAAPLALLLHGFPDAPGTWSAVGPALARRGWRVVAPATRGYPPTEAPAGDDYGTATLGRDALALATALGAPRFAVVGHDWGALAAYAAATEAPARVTKLVAVAIPHPGALTPAMAARATHFVEFPLPGAPARFAADGFAGWDAIVRRWSPAWTPSAADREDAVRPFRAPGATTAIFGYYRAFMADLLAGRRVPWRPLATPALLVYGEADGALDAAAFPASRAWLTGPVKLVGLPGVGHFPQRERPEAVAGAIADFLGAAQ